MATTATTFWRKESILLLLSAFLLGTGIDILLYQSALRPLAAEVRFFAVFLPLGLIALLPALANFVLTSRVKKLLLPRSITISLLVVFLGYLLGFFFSRDPILHGLHLSLWVVWFLLILMLTTSRSRRSTFAIGVIISGVLASVLAVMQVLTQGSIGLHLFGEASFSIDQIGTSRIVFGDLVMQRGYALFPHPNIAFAWISVALFALCSFGHTFSWREHPERLLLFLLLTLGLVATGSKSLLIILVSSIVSWILTYLLPRQKKSSIIPIILVSFTFLGTALLVLFGGSDTVVDRLYFLQGAWSLFSHTPFGTGLGSMPLELSLSASLAPWMLQPVHNTFALVFVEGGILAGLGWIAFHGALLLQTLNNRSREAFLPLTMLLVLIGTSAIDHYWVTYPPLFLVSAYLVSTLLSKHLARRAG